MSREEAHIIRKQERQSRRVENDEHRCILCEGAIEHADHETYFVTGHCRHCTEALED